MKNQDETKIVIKIERELKEKFQEYCTEQGRSMTGQIIYWINKSIGGGIK